MREERDEDNQCAPLGFTADAIAIVGMSGRFPGADTLEQLWVNLAGGTCSISGIPGDRGRYWDLAGLADLHEPVCRWGGFLGDVDRFDAAFFGIPPREAAFMDPQQRLFLEEAWKAIEDAGYAREALHGTRCGVYVGQMSNDYHNLLTHATALAPQAYEMMGAACFTPGRVGYHLNLRGPAMAVDTASSSSMVALHLACRALQQGDIDMAIAGGVSLFLTQKNFHVMERVGILSHTGVCRPFDDGADGTVPGEAITAVVMKRLERALADRDAIHGVILASGVNQAGDADGITAPGMESQRELMREVHQAAGIEPGTIQYIEAHGTGTPKGDPVEAQALREAFASAGPNGGKRRLGSSKANLGHGFSAAGTTALIKVLLALRHRAVPPQINHETLNGRIDPDWPFRVNTALEQWQENDGSPRRAAVCGVGFTGTNGYLVLEQAPAVPDREPLPAEAEYWITLSAENAGSLVDKARDLDRWIADADRDLRLDDLAFTLNVGRSAFTERLAFRARDIGMVRNGLRSFLDGETGNVEIHRGRADEGGQETDFSRAGASWVNGASIDWGSFYGDLAPHRLHLPVHVFADQRYWFDMAGDAAVLPPVHPAPASAKSAGPEPRNPVRLRDLNSPAGTAARSVPVTSTGDGGAGARVSPAPKAGPAPDAGEAIVARLRDLVAGILYVESSAVDVETRFVDLGLDSILAVELAKSIAARFDCTLAASTLYDYPNVRQLAAHLSGTAGGQPADSGTGTGPESTKTAVRHGLLEEIRRLTARVLYVDAADLDVEAKFSDLGLDSILAVELVRALRTALGVNLTATDLYDQPTIRGLAAYLATQPPTPSTAAVHEPDGEFIERLRQAVADTLFVNVAAIDIDTKFADLGLDSILAVELAKSIQSGFGATLTASTLYDHPTIRQLAAVLANSTSHVPRGGFDPVAPARPAAIATADSAKPVGPVPAMPTSPAAESHSRPPRPEFGRSVTGQRIDSNRQRIAIVGMAGRFPEAADVDAFWSNLAEGRRSIGGVPADRVTPLGFFDPDTVAKYRAGFIDGIDRFDAAFFNMGRTEAEQTDPQHRLFLQEAWKAVEDAGYQPVGLAGGRCGIFLGMSMSDYFPRITSHDPHSLLGNMGSGLTGRLSYLFDWSGPCHVLDNACASSFAALDLACRSLKAGDCDAALVGGVHVATDSRLFTVCHTMGLLSPRDECRTFDTRADGWVIGEAVGAVLLKRLDDAVRDGDHVYAVIRGCGVNQDGAKNGLTAPKAAKQLQLQKQVYEQAKIDPRTIGLLEAHGTSSVLGDEAELSALGECFGDRTSDSGYCAIGSLKPNIGHPLEAAGIACLIKVAQALHRGQLPPMVPVGQASEALAAQFSPFYLSTELRDWRRPGGHPRRAAINGLSLTGTNSHVILEEFDSAAMGRDPAGGDRPAVFMLSARTEAQLRQYAARIARFLEGRTDLDLNDLVFTLQTGRQPMRHRLAFVADSVRQAQRHLSDFLKSYETPSVCHGQIEESGAAISLLTTGEDGRRFVEGLIKSRSLQELARLWVAGADIDWNLLHQGTRRFRLSLPAYPFGSDRYWIATQSGAAGAGSETADQPPGFSQPGQLPLEERIRATICQVLGAERGELGLDEDLSRQGLGSLHALRAIEIIRQRDGVRISPRLFFESRTVRELARRVEQSSEVVPDRPHDPVPPATALEINRTSSAAGDLDDGIGAAGTGQAAVRYELCESQKAIWLIQNLDDGNRGYHLPFALYRDEPIEIPALTRALAELSAAHPALRTTLPFAAGEPFQVVGEPGPVEVVQFDAQQWSETRVLDCLRDLGGRPFDLSQGPLWRVAALSLPGNRSLLLLVFHHLVFDGHSLGVVLEEIEHRYRLAREGKTWTPAPVRYSFADFVRQEAAYLAGVHYEVDRDFWLGRYPQGFVALDIPTDGSGREEPGEIIPTSIPAARVAALGDLAAAERTTIQGVFLAAFEMLLAMAGRQQRVVAGVATDLRPATGFDRVTGCFANVLPVSAEIPASMPFREVLRQVFGTLVESFEHRRMPFRRLARVLAEEASADPPRYRLQAAFYFQSWENHEQRRLAGRLVPGIHQSGEFDLVFEVFEQEHDWRLNVKYRPGVYSQGNSQNLAARYLDLLDRIAADPGVTIADCLQAARLAAKPAAPPAFDYPGCCVDELIDEQAGQRPDAVAAIFEDEQMTYRGLNRCADQLAAQLAVAGVRPGDLVGVMMHRSLEMLISLLGVWRAGAAYVPLDPAYPAGRIDYMLRDSGAAVVLTQASPDHEPRDTRVVTVDAGRLLGESQARPESDPPRDPDSLAYVIYTSGSSGDPKGVQITHRSLVHFLSCMADRPGCSARDKVLALTTISFDISALELFLPLVTGARVEILPEATVRDGLRLKSKVESSGATIIQATPATWKMLLAAELGEIPAVKALCGGEAWDAQLAGQLLDRVGELWNMYGPTETTIWSSIQKIERGEPVRLGEPIGNTRFYVVDEAMNQVEPGEVGELLIGGDGLARGYLNRPDLDRERFIADPFGEEARIYRTGDLVRYV